MPRISPRAGSVLRQYDNVLKYQSRNVLKRVIIISRKEGEKMAKKDRIEMSIKELKTLKVVQAAMEGEAPEEKASAVAGKEGVFWRAGADRRVASRLAGRQGPEIALMGYIDDATNRVLWEVLRVRGQDARDGQFQEICDGQRAADERIFGQAQHVQVDEEADAGRGTVWEGKA